MKNLIKDYKLLLKSIPAFVTISFIISVVLMNIMANKLMFQWGWLAGDCGILVSWLPFLTMDIVTKRFGPKAATRLNILGLCVNLFCVFMLFIASIMPYNPENQYEAFNYLFGPKNNWFIWLGSAVAFLVSGYVNNFSNYAVGKLFKKNPDGKLAYVSRTYVSTFLGQFIDNVVFAFIAFWIFGNYFWKPLYGFDYTIAQCFGAGVLGALIELAMEVVFSPFGYKLSQKWKREGVGQEYIDAHPEDVI